MGIAAELLKHVHIAHKNLGTSNDTHHLATTALAAAEEDCGMLEIALAEQQAAVGCSKQQKKTGKGLESPLISPN